MSDELCGKVNPDPAFVTTSREHHEYGRLWPDGTFVRLSDYEKYARDEFESKSYELRDVPESLRPVFGRRKIVTTTDTYAPGPFEEIK